MLFQSEEFLAVMSDPITPRSQAEMVRLRLHAEASLALHALSEDELALLPEGRIEFNSRAVLEIDTESIWVRLSIDKGAASSAGTASERDWLATGHLLQGLHEWIMIEERKRGGSDRSTSWEVMTRRARITAAHTFFQLLDLITIFVTLAENLQQASEHQGVRRSGRRTHRFVRRRQRSN